MITDNLQELQKLHDKLNRSMGKFKVDILIPYHDNEDTTGQALASISVQTTKDDIRVLICNDGSTAKSSVELMKIVNSYQNIGLSIEVFDEYFHNVGQTRESLLQKSAGEYILFLDADDMLYTPYAVEMLCNVLEGNPAADIVTTPFLEEKINKGQKALYQRGFEITTLLGKMYRREFITKNNIYFPKVTRNEDAFFNQLAACYEPMAIQLEQPIYVWKYNPRSLSRNTSNPDLSYERKLDYFKNQKLLYEAKEHRDILSKNQPCINQTHETVVMMYLYFIELYEENPKKADEFQEQCARFFKTFDGLCIEQDFSINDNLKNIYLNISNSFPTLKTIIPCMTFREFLIELVTLSCL